MHIEHFLADKMYLTYSSVFCFTETHIDNQHYKNIEEYQLGWKSIHRNTEHGLAICYDTSRVEIVKTFTTPGELQVLPVLLKIDDELVFLVLLYRPPRPMQQNDTFVYELIQILSMLPLDEYGEYRTLIVGDFNMDQMVDENIRKFDQLCAHFQCHQRSNYSTHRLGGILDLVFDDRSSESVGWMPSPYSDHFVIVINL